MTPRTLRNLLVLTVEVQRQIRAAGRTPPPQEYLMSAMLPHARTVTRAARALGKAERQVAQARALAHECAVSALAMAGSVAQGCIESTPASPQFVPFDAAKFTVSLASLPAGTEAPLTAGELS